MKNLKNLKKGVAIFLSAVFAVSGMGLQAGNNSYAATDTRVYTVNNPTESIASKNPDTADNNLSISKTAAETGTANQYEITFSMPNQNTSLKKTVDVVFVMDKSSVSYNNNALKDAAISLISQMRASVDADPNVTFNVGVLAFHEYIFASTQGLLDIRDDNNLNACIESLKSESKSGSAVETGIMTAYDWLKNAGDADAKYMINCTDYSGYLLSDGSTVGMHRYVGETEYWQDTESGSMDQNAFEAATKDSIGS
jgi:hypothetical protein